MTSTLLHILVEPDVFTLSNGGLLANQRKDIEPYVANYHTCQRTETCGQLPYGVIHHLPMPECPRRDICIDFVTRLPGSNGLDAIRFIIAYQMKL
jgi:hypothetical protein